VQLPTIRAAGFTAAVYACALDGEDLWFLSMLGSQQSVRALWARLVKGETAHLSEGELDAGSPCWLAREVSLGENPTGRRQSVVLRAPLRPSQAVQRGSPQPG
jgi:hypothetical protein